jgi:hypothetical protein
VCSKDGGLGRTALRTKKSLVIAVALWSKTNAATLHNRTKFEVAVEARRRELAWIERKNFQGWACSECAWAFNPSGPLVGDSLGDMKMHYEQQRDKEFKSHVCTEHPGAKKNPG